MYPNRKHYASDFVSDFASSYSHNRINNSGMENRIKELRQLAGLSMQKLADKVGATKGTIQKLESGGMEFTLTWMNRLAKALHCEPQDFLPRSKPKIYPVNEKLIMEIATYVKDILGAKVHDDPVDITLKTLKVYNFFVNKAAEEDAIELNKTTIQLIMNQRE